MCLGRLTAVIRCVFSLFHRLSELLIFFFLDDNDPTVEGRSIHVLDMDCNQ